MSNYTKSAQGFDRHKKHFIALYIIYKHFQ